MKSLVSFLLVTLTAGCRTHELEDGTYAFSVTQSVRDDCALQGVPGVVANGVLRTTGDVVRLDYDYFKIQLNGTYESQVERMSLDGSATNVEMDVQNVDCLLDVVTLHLDATAADPETFSGLMSFSLQAMRPESCVCELWIGYQAKLTQLTP